MASIARVTSLQRLTLLVLVPFLALTAACGGGSTTPKADNSQCHYTKGGPTSKKVDLPPGDPASDEPKELTIATNHGDIKVSLDADKAPCTVNAFVSLAKQGFFDNTHCHRLVTQGLHLLQCGDPKASGKPGDPNASQGGPGYLIKDELVQNDPRLQPCGQQVDPQTGAQVCTYTAGTVALANGGPDTGGSQFFLLYQDSVLPNAYTVFGKMSAAGVNVVRGIAKAGAYPPDSTTGNTPPKEETIITSVK